MALPLAGAAATRAATSNGAETGVPGPKAAAASWHYFDRRTRLTVAMWDFSWLHASHPGGPYAGPERRVAEARERGYNTLRVDCFPSRFTEPKSTFEKNWTAGADLPAWGQRAVTFTCEVRKKVAELAAHCRKHGVWLGLDSWDKAHMFGHDDTIAEADEERELTRYGETWAKALKLMREDGVLERAVWIAPMNEVPHYAGRKISALARLKDQPKHEGETQLNRDQQADAIYRRVNRWIAEPIKAEVARENIPISYSSLGAEDYSARLTDHYDVVDVHFMPNVILDDEDCAAFEQAGKGAAGFVAFNKLKTYNLKAYSQAWDRACRKHYASMLQRVRDYHATALTHTSLPSGKKLAAVITESFGPCYWPDHPDVGWDWYKRYNADALRVVASMDFQGSSLSNYAEPIFSLWDDVTWHSTSNAYFQTASAWTP